MGTNRAQFIVMLFLYRSVAPSLLGHDISLLSCSPKPLST